MFIPGSNYFPYRPETNLAFERDYKSYPEYETNAYHENRDLFVNSPSPTYLNYIRNIGTMTPSRKPPQMGLSASHHRRTHSNTSGNSNINTAFNHLEPDEPSNYQYGRINQMQNRLNSTSPINRMRAYENIPFHRHNELPAHNFMPSTALVNTEFQATFDRPDSLPFDLGNNTKLRSSLRKYTNTSPRFGASTASTIQMQANKSSPTKTTPSDSLTSDDSSYLSAKEGSISSQSRVRFSPETMLDQATSSTFNTPIRRLSRSQRHSISDMLAPTTSS